MNAKNTNSKTSGVTSLKVKSNIKAGIIAVCKADRNHNQALVREAKKSLRVKTNLKAGATHKDSATYKEVNHNHVLVREAKKSLRVKTSLKAGLKLKL